MLSGPTGHGRRNAFAMALWQDTWQHLSKDNVKNSKCASLVLVLILGHGTRGILQRYTSEPWYGQATSCAIPRQIPSFLLFFNYLLTFFLSFVRSVLFVRSFF
jgi:hypothetical protein